MPNYPKLITQTWADNQKAPDEERIVRLELHGCYNYRPVPITGKGTQRFHFVYDNQSACHALEIPETVWMADNGKLARDLLLYPFNNFRIVVLLKKIGEPAKTETKKKRRPAKPAARPEDAAMAVLGG